MVQGELSPEQTDSGAAAEPSGAEPSYFGF